MADIELKIQNQTNQIHQNSEEMKEKITEQVAITIDELVTEKLDSSLAELKSIMDIKEQEAKIKYQEMLDKLRMAMEDREKAYRKQLEQKNGFWSRLFGG